MSDHTGTTSPRLLPPAVASGLAGGLLVGLTTAVIAFAFIGPLRGYGFDFVDTLFVALIGGVFGVVAGAVAGASESGEAEPAAPAVKAVKAQPTKPSMTPAHRSA
jgi:predicted lipid-binding transport protein (Tim44 family)